MEKKTIEVIVGKKVEGEVDESKILPNTKPEGEVQGHWHQEYLQCPYNGEIFLYNISDSRYYYYRCQGCGQLFVR